MIVERSMFGRWVEVVLCCHVLLKIPIPVTYWQWKSDRLARSRELSMLTRAL